MFKYLKSLFKKKPKPAPDLSYRNNKSQEYLFIGGVNDGQRILIPDNENYITIPPVRPLTDTTYSYYKTIHHSHGNIVCLYVHDKIPHNNVFQILVDNYHPKP